MAVPAVRLPPIDDARLWGLMTRAEELGLRLEMTDTGLVWEAMLGLRHQELEAVVEIASPESEGKNLVAGPPLYLANGVKDVVALHRPMGEVHHWTATGARTLLSPATIRLACGCQVMV